MGSLVVDCPVILLGFEWNNIIWKPAPYFIIIIIIIVIIRSNESKYYECGAIMVLLLCSTADNTCLKKMKTIKLRIKMILPKHETQTTTVWCQKKSS